MNTLNDNMNNSQELSLEMCIINKMCAQIEKIEHQIYNITKKLEKDEDKKIYKDEEQEDKNEKEPKENNSRIKSDGDGEDSKKNIGFYDWKNLFKRRYFFLCLSLF